MPPLIEHPFHTPIEFALHPPLLERFGLETGAYDHGRVFKPVQAEDLQRLEDAGPVFGIIFQLFTQFLKYLHHLIHIFPVGDAEIDGRFDDRDQGFFFLGDLISPFSLLESRQRARYTFQWQKQQQPA